MSCISDEVVVAEFLNILNRHMLNTFENGAMVAREFEAGSEADSTKYFSHEAVPARRSLPADRRLRAFVRRNGAAEG
jgi:hypothetical protein